MLNIYPRRPIERFLSEAERRLRLHVSEAELSVILEEAEAHLQEKAAASISAGAEPIQAEKISVRQFDDVREWAACIVRGSYADAYTTVARNWSLIGLAVLFCVQLASIAGLGLTSLVLQLLGWLGYLGLGVFVVGAFRARYYFPKQQLLIGVIAAAASLVVGGFGMRVSSGMGGGMIDRPGLIWQLQATRDDVKWDQSQIALLDIGIQTYGKAGLPSSVPSVLMSQGRYIVPVVNGQVASLYSTHAHYSPFKAVPSAYEIRPNVAMSDLTRPLYDAPIQTAPTAAAAAIAWRENAAVTLDESQAILGRDTSVLRTYQSYNASAGFDAQAGQGELMQRLAFACAAVLLGLIASAFGRLVFRLRASPRVETSHA